MNTRDAELFVLYFAKHYLAHVMPPEVMQAIELPLPDTLYPLVMDWTKKHSFQTHWDGILSSSDADRLAKILADYNQALADNVKLWLGYEGKSKRFQFNPFGLVVRDRNAYAVGSYWDQTEPFLLAVRKITYCQRLDTPRIAPPEHFDLAQFAESLLNHPLPDATIAKLVVEFPSTVYSYVKSYPLVCQTFHIDAPEGADYFRIEAYPVTNTVRLRQWLSGFQGAAQVIEPLSLRAIVNRDSLDPLTQLYNRKAFARIGHRAIEACRQRAGYCFTVLVMDIDHFKRINDEHGHSVGDNALQIVADHIRTHDGIRYGGEEFVILLPDSHLEQAQIVAERIRQNVARCAITNSHNQPLSITLSIGIAEFPRHLSDSERQLLTAASLTHDEREKLLSAIIERADQAMYRAKRQGRNCYQIYE